MPPEPEGSEREADSGSDDQRPSQATQAVGLAANGYRFAMSPAGEPLAVAHNGPNIARMLRGGRESLRAQLAAEYIRKYGRAPSSSALADALLVLEGRAHEHVLDVHLRVARTDDDRIVVDVGDASGRAIIVGPDGWHVAARSPVLFRRTELTNALPIPEPDGQLDELRALLNFTDDSWPLFLAFLVAALIPEIPHPIALFTGEQGDGKSTAARIAASLIDPSPAPLRSAPRDLDQWAVAASGSWVVALDNVSVIQPWAQDAFCRASTGDGLVKRRLYADDSLVVLSFRRVVMLTSIDPGALRGDLADRLVVFDLQRIGRWHRRTDRDIDERWHEAHPRILGALLNLTAAVLAALPTVRLDHLPRMADFARVVAALDQVLGTRGLDAYLGLEGRLAAEVVESDPVAERVRAFVTDRGAWTGTATALLTLLTPDPAPRRWPTSARALAGQLRRVAPALRHVGVHYEPGREPGTGNRLAILTCQQDPDRPSRPSQPSLALPDKGSARDGRGDGRDDLPASTVTGPQSADLGEHAQRDGCDGRDGDVEPPSDDDWADDLRAEIADEDEWEPIPDDDLLDQDDRVIQQLEEELGATVVDDREPPPLDEELLGD
jgi:hypothetical protein